MADERSIPAAASPSAGGQPLSAEQAWRWLAEIAAQLAALHDRGSLHGAVIAENIHLDDSGRPQLAAPLAAIEWNNGSAGRRCPPELQDKPIGQLPTDLTAARQRLAAIGIAVDPRRIDVYQLGALVCQLAGNSDVDAYLRSAKARAKIPARLRPIVDRCLGYDPSARFSDCSQVIAAVRAAEEASHAAEAETPPQGIAGPLSRHTPSAGHRPVEELAEASAVAVPPPARLGNYRIIGRIGGGGMGDVYKAIDEGLDRIVAVKVLPPELARHRDFVRRFRAEATAIARLAHPNIVHVFACGEDAGRHYYAMQFVAGQSLADLLQQRPKLGVDETLRIVTQCLSGLAAAHEQGLIHRDIKPGNILLDEEHDRALVADFGLVKMSDSGENLTATGVIMGTVDYLPPEQARGLKVDRRSDLYSVGALMYRMHSGRLPFEADSPTGMIFQHAFEQPKPLREVAPEVPEALAGIVMRLLEKYPDNRYQSAELLLTAIEDFRAGKPVVHPIAVSDPAPVASGRREPAGDSRESVAPSLPPVVLGRRGWHTRLWTAFHAHAPAVVKELLDTQHQADGAVLEYQRRRDQLAQIVYDAAQVVTAFEAQVVQHRQAAAEAARQAAAATDGPDSDEARRQQAELERVANEFAAQLTGHQKQLHDLRLQLATVDATLGKLRSQRHALEARLKAAQAEMALDAVGRAGKRTRRLKPLPTFFVAVALCLALALVIMIVSYRDFHALTTAEALRQEQMALRARARAVSAPTTETAQPPIETPPPVIPQPPRAPGSASLVGRLMVKGKDTGLLVRYVAGRLLKAAPVREYVANHRFEINDVELALRGTLHVDAPSGQAPALQAKNVAVWQQRGTPGGGGHRLYIDDQAVGPADDAGQKTFLYPLTLAPGDHQVTWLLTGRDLDDDNLIEFFDSHTRQPLSLEEYQPVLVGGRRVSVVIDNLAEAHHSMHQLPEGWPGGGRGVLPAAVPRPASDAVSLIGRPKFENKDIGLVVRYAAGRRLKGSMIEQFLLEHGGELSRLKLDLEGVLYVPRPMQVGVWHKGGTEAGGVNYLYVDSREIGSIGHHRTKEASYSIALAAGNHTVRWRLVGGVLGDDNLLEFFDPETRQPLSLVAIAPRDEGPILEVVDNLSAPRQLSYPQLSAASPPATTTVADTPVWPGRDSAGWSALAGLVDPTRDKLNATWIINGDVVEFSAHKPRAYVSIPVVMEGSYELSASITLVRAKEATALYLPVGPDRAMVLDMRGDHGNTESSTATTRLLGLKPEPSPEQAATITVGTEYNYTVQVAVTDPTAKVVVQRDGRPLFQWFGPLSAISDKNIRPGTVGLETAYYTTARIRGLRLKTISGQAAPVGAAGFLKMPSQ